MQKLPFCPFLRELMSRKRFFFSFFFWLMTDQTKMSEERWKVRVGTTSQNEHCLHPTNKGNGNSNVDCSFPSVYNVARRLYGNFYNLDDPQ